MKKLSLFNILKEEKNPLKYTEYAEPDFIDDFFSGDVDGFVEFLIDDGYKISDIETIIQNENFDKFVKYLVKNNYIKLIYEIFSKYFSDVTEKKDKLILEIYRDNLYVLFSNEVRRDIDLDFVFSNTVDGYWYGDEEIEYIENSMTEDMIKTFKEIYSEENNINLNEIENKSLEDLEKIDKKNDTFITLRGIYSDAVNLDFNDTLLSYIEEGLKDFFYTNDINFQTVYNPYSKTDISFFEIKLEYNFLTTIIKLSDDDESLFYESYVIDFIEYKISTGKIKQIDFNTSRIQNLSFSSNFQNIFREMFFANFFLDR